MSFHSRLLFVPATALFAAGLPAPAVAVELQTLQQAQQKLAPGATLTPADFKLSSDDHALLKQQYKVPSMRPAVKAWRVSTGGWLFLDQVYGRDDIVTYLVSIGDDNKLHGLEVLVCADGYCDLFTQEWRANLVGRTHGKWMPEDVVPIVSGATLSCEHIAQGVKKLLAIHARFMVSQLRMP
jgi:hypothetical protein